MRRTYMERALAAATLVALFSACGGGGTTIVNVTPTITVTGTNVDTGCQPGAPTIQANGVSTCQVTLNLTLAPPIANFLSMAVSANGPAGSTLYSTTDTGTEPIGSGTRQRLFSVAFDPVNGAATLDVYLRSTTSGPGTLTLASNGALNQSVDVSFAVDTSIPATLSIAAQSFVAAGGGYTDVVATVLNGVGSPLQNFTITFTHDDPNGRYCVPSPPCSGATLPPITAVTDAGGQATARFSTTDTARHDVALTVQITGPVAYLAPQSTTVTAFDSKTEVSKIEYVIVSNGGQSGDASPAGVDAFYGATDGVADVLHINARARSIDEVTKAADCNCDAATDTVTTINCTDVLEVACPVSGQSIEIACPPGLTNPAPSIAGSACQFALSGDTGFAVPDNACTLDSNGRCVHFTCGAGTPCVINDFLFRVVSNSVAAPGLSAPATFPDSFFESITPKTKVSLSSGTPNPPADRCAAGYTDCAATADPTVFLPDPDLGAAAVFTRPLTADGLVDKCQVLGAGNDYFRCSDVSSDYLPEPPSLPSPIAPNTVLPRIPFRFEVRDVLGNVSAVTLPADTLVEFTDARGTSAPPFRACDGTSTCSFACSNISSAAACAASATGLIDYPSPGGDTVASKFENLFYYPRFAAGAYNVTATVKAPTQPGFLNAGRTLQANPQCNTPVVVSCAAASGTGPAPSASVPDSYYNAFAITGSGLNLTRPRADGYVSDFVTCQVQSFAQANPGVAKAAPFNCPLSDTDAANVINSSAFSVRALADADSDAEKFCKSGSNCDLGGNFSSDLKLDNPTINANGFLQVQFYVRVDSATVTTATFATNFTARVIQDADPSAGGFQVDADPANDLSPADLIKTSPDPSITMDRDNTLAKDVVLTFFKADAVTSASSIYSQAVIAHSHALDIRALYALNAASGQTDPFAARVNIQVRDYNNDTYVDTNGAHPGAPNPLCTVQIAPNGGLNTKVGAVTGGAPGTCQSPSITPISKVQTTGSGTIDNTICMISDGTVSAATGNATLQATLSGCGSAVTTANLTVNSVLRGAKFPVRVRNLTGSQQSFNAGQMGLDLDTTVFCKNLASPCANTAQYLGVAPDTGTFTGTRTANVVYAAGPPVQVNGTAEEVSGCSNTFVVPASGFLPAWTVDLSIAPDAGGGMLAQRLAFSTTQADTALDTTGDSKFTFKQFINWAAGCGSYTLIDSSLAWDAQAGTPLFVGGP